jgi:protein required for attachment to host cells
MLPKEIHRIWKISSLYTPKKRQNFKNLLKVLPVVMNLMNDDPSDSENDPESSSEDDGSSESDDDQDNRDSEHSSFKEKEKKEEKTLFFACSR